MQILKTGIHIHQLSLLVNDWIWNRQRSLIPIGDHHGQVHTASKDHLYFE
jgi:hypothetical protein